MTPLSDRAGLALWSLCGHPELSMPDLIESAVGLEQVDAAAILDGLRELEQQGLAREADGGWELTAAGRQECG